MTTAEPAPPTDGLREEIARALDTHMTLADFDRGCAMRCGYAGEERDEHLADALLSGPLASVLQRLIAAEEAVRRVRELADRYDQLAAACDEGRARVMTRSTADRIRRALDGDR